MKYVLEAKTEYERLEEQSSTPAYDFRIELKDFHPKKYASILDAGCGSGIVSRFLAGLYPESTVVGCDMAKDRVDRASVDSKKFSNLSFVTQNLSKTTFENGSFDSIICRYVIEHLDKMTADKTFSEFYRCLRPNGNLCVVDMDGFLFNLFPQTPLVSEVLEEIAKRFPIDLYVGRKLPNYMVKAGFENISYRIDTMEFKGESLEIEAHLQKERFDATAPHLEKFFGDAKKVKKFVSEYLNCLKNPNAVLFYNKFVVTGQKPGLKK